MRGLKRLRSARVICVGPAFVHNLCRRHYELAVHLDPSHWILAACTELARHLNSTQVTVDRAALPRRNSATYSTGTSAVRSVRYAATFERLTDLALNAERTVELPAEIRERGS